MKQGEKYLSPRERAIGTTYWGRMAETIVVIEPKAGDGNAVRELHILPRQAAAEIHCFKWENGQLVEAPCPDAHDHKPPKHADRAADWLEKNKKPGDKFNLAELESALGEKSNSLSYPLSADGPLGKKGWVEKVEYGVYRWNGRSDENRKETAGDPAELTPKTASLVDQLVDSVAGG